MNHRRNTGLHNNNNNNNNNNTGRKGRRRIRTRRKRRRGEGEGRGEEEREGEDEGAEEGGEREEGGEEGGGEREEGGGGGGGGEEEEEEACSNAHSSYCASRITTQKFHIVLSLLLCVTCGISEQTAISAVHINRLVLYDLGGECLLRGTHRVHTKQIRFIHNGLRTLTLPSTLLLRTQTTT